MKEFCTIKDAAAISLNLEVHQYKKKIRANLIKKSDRLGVGSILNNCCTRLRFAYGIVKLLCLYNFW